MRHWPIPQALEFPKKVSHIIFDVGGAYDNGHKRSPRISLTIRTGMIVICRAGSTTDPPIDGSSAQVGPGDSFPLRTSLRATLVPRSVGATTWCHDHAKVAGPHFRRDSVLIS